MNPDATIFIVDDDEEDRLLLAGAFSQIGLEENVALFSNGEHLMSHLESMECHSLPDLIVLDYNMPKLNGLEVLSKIKERSGFSSIKVVIYSTSINEHMKHKCIELGAVDCLTKPTDFGNQIKMVRQLYSLAI